MTNREAIEYASKHSFLELYELGYQEGKHEAILQQANHDQAVQQAYEKGRMDMAKEQCELINCDNTDDCLECVFYDYHDDEGQLVTYCRLKEIARGTKNV